MKKNYNLYLGKAGHIMSEFLTRGWNVAIPEVDIGDDIFVVQDNNGILKRVQVKTSTSTLRKNGYSAQFMVPLTQLRNIVNIPVHYVFIVRNNDLWTKPLIIRQDYLRDHFENEKFGSLHNGNLSLYFSYSKGKVKCSGLDITKYLSDFTDFPLIGDDCNLK